MAANVVASSQPLATQAGVEAFRRGGNAVDAALATAITLTVVEPVMNGIGSDAFCILWDGNELHGLNASGRSPMDASIEDYRGMKEMPLYGWDTVTVPGCVSAWVSMSEKFGALPFEDLFESAIRYASDGFLVSPITAERWQDAPETYAEFEDFKSFLVNGNAPLAGELFRHSDQAKTLEEIARTKGESFYRGALASKMVETANAAGNKLSMSDLNQHSADWVGTISQSYGDYQLHEIPPNGQGLAALIALGILDQFDMEQYAVDSIDSFHLQIEAMKLAFADLYRYVSDFDHLEFDVKYFLDEGYLKQRAALIDIQQAGNPDYGVPDQSGTIYLSTADSNGMMVSFIQSNYHGFGSGIVIPDTGICLQNRGAGFNLIPGHPNQFAGGKRPFHTIIPGFLMEGDQPRMSFGVMGGPMQAQGHVQMVLRICTYGQNPQTASDAPRWQVVENNGVAIESGLPVALYEGLKQRGHVIHEQTLNPEFSMGGAQLILKTDHGYIAGSDHRKDGQAAGF